MVLCLMSAPARDMPSLQIQHSSFAQVQVLKPDGPKQGLRKLILNTHTHTHIGIEHCRHDEQASSLLYLAAAWKEGNSK